MSSIYVYTIIFVCIAYLIVTDESIAKLVFFTSTIVKNRFLIFKWWLIHNPSTPWARYSMHRKSMKLAEELIKELENRDNE